MLRFILSHASTERRSAIRFSISFGSSVGIARPGIGTPSGPQRRLNISKGSCVCGSAMDVAFGSFEEFLDLARARNRVLVAKIDERATEGLLEEEVARQVGA